MTNSEWSKFLIAPKILILKAVLSFNKVFKFIPIIIPPPKVEKTAVRWLNFRAASQIRKSTDRNIPWIATFPKRALRIFSHIVGTIVNVFLYNFESNEATSIRNFNLVQKQSSVKH